MPGILVVEDDENLNRGITFSLKKSGYEVFSAESVKKAAMKLSSLPLKMSVSYRNRTYNRVLGGPRYIHLTKETNAVFSGFSALLAPATISMNSITLVMNFHCILF